MSGLVIRLPADGVLEDIDHLDGQVELPRDAGITVGDVVSVQNRYGVELGRCMVVSVKVNDGPKMLVTLGALIP